MNKIQTALNTLGKTLNKNSPTIMIGLGLSGLIGSTVMAVKATPKALELIDKELYRIYLEKNPDLKWDDEAFMLFKHTISRYRHLPPKALVALCWRLYTPAAASAVLGTTAIILGNRLHLRRAAVLASLYSLAENTLHTYQKKVIESVGQTKADAIFSEAGEDLITESPDEENIHNVGGGTELCYEVSTGRYFESDVTKIRAAENEFNKELIIDNEKPMNELFYMLGLPAVSLGENAGWAVDDGLLEILINPKISTNGERPCLAIDFTKRPKPLWI